MYEGPGLEILECMGSPGCNSCIDGSIVCCCVELEDGAPIEDIRSSTNDGDAEARARRVEICR